MLPACCSGSDTASSSSRPSDTACHAHPAAPRPAGKPTQQFTQQCAVTAAQDWHPQAYSIPHPWADSLCHYITSSTAHHSSCTIRLTTATPGLAILWHCHSDLACLGAGAIASASRQLTGQMAHSQCAAA
jgi:hypothetical protein